MILFSYPKRILITYLGCFAMMKLDVIVYCRYVTFTVKSKLVRYSVVFAEKGAVTAADCRRELKHVLGRGVFL